MPRLRPPDVSLPDAVEADVRVGHLLGRDLGPDEVPVAVLVGFPSDEGVRRSGGRPGASEGPGAIRSSLYRLTPDARDDRLARLLTRSRDLGDLDVGGDLDAAQQSLGEVLAPYLARGVFAIVLGGGHETSYGHFLGYAAAGLDVHLVNWDSHTDVRELKEGRGHSGSPFRQALEHPSGRSLSYAAAGLQPHSVAADHAAFVHAHGRVIWRQDVTAETAAGLYRGGATCLVSFDLDAVDQSAAPGVSAPAADGLPTEVWLAAAETAGAALAVASADVVELCPALDPDGRTARLAALTVWRILRGVASRP
jgi:formiminoglutamase